ncbi:hypothetical protein JCM8547_008486 [Rhodosporidiobolus lusitaniae]
MLLRLLALFALSPLLPSSTFVSATSLPPPPLHPRALSHPSDLSFHVLPRPPPTLPNRENVNRLTRRQEEEPALGLGLGLRSGGRQPEWDDRFLLSFLLPAHDGEGEGEAVTLSLRPSLNLVPSSGIKTYTRTLDPETDEWTTTESVLRREDARVFEGWVLGEEEDVPRWVAEEVAGLVRYPGGGREGEGWARVTLLDVREGEEKEEGEGNLRFQGVFQKRGEVYTVHAVERYLRTKGEEDPEPPVVAVRKGGKGRRTRRAFGTPGEGEEEEDEEGRRHPSMVVVRESETLTPAERIAALQKRGLPLPPLPSAGEEEESFCSHDQLPFNSDPSHPVLLNAWEQSLYPPPSSSPYTSPSNTSTSSLFSLSSLPFLSSPSSSELFQPFDHSSSPHSLHGRYRRRSQELSKRQGDDISGGSGTSSNFINSIGSTTGCPKQARVVFVGVAADCTYVEAYGSTDAARTQILNDFNDVSALYQTSFNVSLGIVELAVMNSTCPTTSSQIDTSNPWNLPCPSSSGSTSTNSSIGIDLNSRLSVFSQWRGDKGAGDGAGLWHLLTACQTGSEVGVAWLGQLCRVTATTSGGQTTSGTGVTAITRSEWQVIAHEIGHNFGAIHDCASGCSLSGSCCPLTTTSCNANADYIMSPVSQKNVSSFSPCSIGNICSTLSNSLNTTCLATPGASGNPTVISLQSCGNGILESGEECDPGSSDDPCCDASTCTFVSGAVCSSRNSGCCDNCQIANNGTVCRAAVDASCDIAETCDGASANCPEDEYENDGKSCGDGLSCAAGVCTSRDLQCQNAGSSLNLTRACSTSATSGCSIICRDPTGSADCVILSTNFRDGTSCANGGRCRNGECQSGSAWDTAKGWYLDHLSIAIPVTIVVGLIVLAILWALIRCIFCGGCRGRRKNTAYVPPKNGAYSGQYAPPPPQQQMGNGQYAYPPPPQQQFGGGYGGGGGYAPPPGPPPSHPSLVRQPGRVLRRG